MKIKSRHKNRPGERSFTIIETMIALGILLPVIVETVATQGSIVNNNAYIRKMTEATWLAKRVMSQVESHYQNYPLKDLEQSGKEERFKDIDRDDVEFDYTYRLTIQEWKLPIFDILLGGGLNQSKEEEEKDEPNSSSASSSLPPFVEDMINSTFDGHIMKTAHVEVFWPEGASRSSVSLTLLLTNQKAVDAALITNKDKIQKTLSELKALREK